jgi:hypothetical protein
MNAATVDHLRELSAAYNRKLDEAEAVYASRLTTSTQPEALRIAMVRMMSQAYCELVAARRPLEAASS